MQLTRIAQFSIALFISIWAACHSVRAEEKPPLRFEDGDAVALIGGSITRGGLYHSFIQLFYATRYPERRLANQSNTEAALARASATMQTESQPRPRRVMLRPVPPTFGLDGQQLDAVKRRAAAGDETRARQILLDARQRRIVSQIEPFGRQGIVKLLQQASTRYADQPYRKLIETFTEQKTRASHEWLLPDSSR